MSLSLQDKPHVIKKKFLAIRDPNDLAAFLNISYSNLIYHAHKVTDNSKYTTFQIPKRSGGYRIIRAPITPLKIIQSKLNQAFQAIYQPKVSVHSYLPDRSILSNANFHTRQKWVLNIDLEDFFPSITFARVIGLFSSIPYSLPFTVSRIIAKLCCCDNELPQGAPSSPMISNMICSRMDSQLLRLAKNNRCFYTRYADDITFSTSMPIFPDPLAHISDLGIVEIGADLQEIIEGNGFTLNRRKVRLQPWYRRQEVTGLVVNKFPNIHRKYINQVRAMIHSRRKFGKEKAFEHYQDYHSEHQHRNHSLPQPDFDEIIAGKINFIGMVRGTDDPIFMKYRKQLHDINPDVINIPPNEMYRFLTRYKELQVNPDPHQRGYLLENLLNDLFEYAEISIERSFRRNKGAEQIDGAIKLNGKIFLVECRWRKDLQQINELDALMGKVRRSSSQARGLFLSIAGWSTHVPDLLKSDPSRSVILMNGTDLEGVLKSAFPLVDLLEKKSDRLDTHNEPFSSIDELSKSK